MLRFFLIKIYGQQSSNRLNLLGKQYVYYPRVVNYQETRDSNSKKFITIEFTAQPILPIMEVSFIVYRQNKNSFSLSN